MSYYLDAMIGLAIVGRYSLESERATTLAKIVAVNANMPHDE